MPRTLREDINHRNGYQLHLITTDPDERNEWHYFSPNGDSYCYGQDDPLGFAFSRGAHVGHDLIFWFFEALGGTDLSASAKLLAISMRLHTDAGGTFDSQCIVPFVDFDGIEVECEVDLTHLRYCCGIAENDVTASIAALLEWNVVQHRGESPLCGFVMSSPADFRRRDDAPGPS